MSTDEGERSRVIKLAAFAEYNSGSILTRTILKKITGHIDVVSVDNTEKAPETISPFDSFIHVIDGKADIRFNKNSHLVGEGEVIIIPANTVYTMQAKNRFKMILTIIKSGYE